MFYLTTHSTHFIYGYVASVKEAFNTLKKKTRLYGVRHMVKDHSDSERGRNEGMKYFI